MSSQEYFIRSAEALTSLLIVSADSARIKQQSNREKAGFLTRLSSVTRNYFSAISDLSILASSSNLDLTMAVLDKADAATVGRPPELHRLTRQFSNAETSRFCASAALALGRVIDTMDFDQALRIVSWIGDNTITIAKPPKLPELPCLLDRLAQRCLKAGDLQSLVKVYDVDFLLLNKALPARFQSERYREFVPPISDGVVEATLAYVARRSWAPAEFKELGTWIGILRPAVNYSSLQNFAEAQDILDQLDIALTDLKRGPILATLDAAAAKLRGATAPTVPKVKAPRATRRARVGDPR